MLCDVSDINDSVERAIQKYINHTIIQIIKETFGSNKTFSLDLVSSDNIFKDIVSLDTKKATHSNDVPTNTVKENADLFSVFVPNAFNESVISCKFLSVLKLAAVKPVHKKKPRLEKTNYQPNSLLHNISKFLKDAYIDKFQNILKLCYQISIGFRKGYSTQDCLLAILEENCKEIIRSWERIWCLTNWPLQSFWLFSTWPYNCETSPIWFFDRITETNI